MTICVKICGLTTETDVAAAVEAGADAVGFVFAESPRRVTVERAVALTRNLPASIVRVAVMRHPTPADWQEVASGFSPDWLQTDVADFARIDCGAGVTRMPVYRDAPGVDRDQIAGEQQVLFEAANSGAGERADWDRAARLAKTTRLMLAGGLDPNNVAAAIRQVRPWGVDVSSGVEKRRGVKDPNRIAAFVNAVRELEN
ncbi:MAG: phosphoribosylanthranilate isomerase [Gammaproteobacteria bacterium]